MTLENETSIEYAHAQLKKFFPTIGINTQELEQKIKSLESADENKED